MLESPSLVLKWLSSATGPATVQICDPQTHAVLGVARTSRGRRPWSALWFAPDFHVFEGEDEALVFSLRSSWFLRPFWLIVDAEGNLIGKLQRRGGNVRFERVEATRETSPTYIAVELVERECPEGLQAVAGSGQGCEWGELSLAGPCTRITFAKWTQGDPFNKMLLLASALVWRRL